MRVNVALPGGIGQQPIDPLEAELGRSVGAGAEGLARIDHDLALARQQGNARRRAAARRAAARSRSARAPASTPRSSRPAPAPRRGPICAPARWPARRDVEQGSARTPLDRARPRVHPGRESAPAPPPARIVQLPRRPRLRPRKPRPAATRAACSVLDAIRKRRYSSPMRRALLALARSSCVSRPSAAITVISLRGSSRSCGAANRSSRRPGIPEPRTDERALLGLVESVRAFAAERGTARRRPVHELRRLARRPHRDDPRADATGIPRRRRLVVPVPRAPAVPRLFRRDAGGTRSAASAGGAGLRRLRLRRDRLLDARLARRSRDVADARARRRESRRDAAARARPRDGLHRRRRRFQRGRRPVHRAGGGHPLFRVRTGCGFAIAKPTLEPRRAARRAPIACVPGSAIGDASRRQCSQFRDRLPQLASATRRASPARGCRAGRARRARGASPRRARSRVGGRGRAALGRLSRPARDLLPRSPAPRGAARGPRTATSRP